MKISRANFQSSISLLVIMGLAGCATTGPISEAQPPHNPTISSPPSVSVPPPVIPPAPPVVPPTQTIINSALIFEKSAFAALPSWAEFDLSIARRAFAKNCAQWANKDPNSQLSQTVSYSGKISDWAAPCAKVLDKTIADKDFWEQNFTPWKISADGASSRLTSYFEPIINANLIADSINNEPLFGKPTDLLSIDLGAFDASLRGKSVVGRIDGARFVPYRSRAEIAPQNAPIVAWTNMGDALSLQIQGSGRLLLPDGRQYRAAFAGHNGKAFGSVARELIRRGELQASGASADAIKNWFEKADPKIAREVINANPRTVFFELKPINDPKEGPKGGAGIPLEAGGALAVDTAYHAYGVPIFVSAFNPRISASENTVLNRLVIAQDTGGAIKGPIRGDYYWGTGVDAGISAGRINHDVNFWALLPKTLEPIKNQAQ